MEKTDISYLDSRCKRELAQRVKRERKQVVLRYLEALRTDFERLLAAAKGVAVLSPEVIATDEWKRVRLSLQFMWRYQVLRWRLKIGVPSISLLGDLSRLVSKLAVEMERAVAELAERTALVTTSNSSLQR